jgi:hypothetical protein
VDAQFAQGLLMRFDRLASGARYCAPFTGLVSAGIIIEGIRGDLKPAS